MSNPPELAWREIDTVLVDMDGTLLDLSYDDYFWRELVPTHYGDRHGISANEAWRRLKPRFDERRGELEWYCLDHWSEELELDLAGIKAQSREHIRFLPESVRFLKGVRRLGKRVVLVTNAHRDALDIKARETGLLDYLDAAHSSHDYGAPKESQGFWHALVANDRAIDKNRSIMIDDSLPVLDAAANFGIRYCVAILRPASKAPRRQVPHHPSVDTIVDLLP